MTPPKLNPEHEIEDYLAKEREFLSQLWEGHYSNRVEYRKQIMTLSVAGLGLNLITNKPGSFGWDFFTGIWGLSTGAFLVTTLLTLWMFSTASDHLVTQAKQKDSQISDEARSALEGEEKKLSNRLKRLAFYANWLFAMGVITAIITVLILGIYATGENYVSQ